MAIAQAQAPVSAATFSATNNHTQTYGSSLILSSVRLAILRTSSGSDTVTSLTGSTSGAYTRLLRRVNTGASTSLLVYYVEGGAAGAETVTLVMTTTGSTVRWGIMEYTGVAPSGVIDVSDSNVLASSTTPATGTITTLTANDMLLFGISTDSAVTTIVPGGTEVERFEVDSRLQVQERLVTTATGYTGSWTNGIAAAGQYFSLALKPDPGGGAPAIGWQQYQQRASTIITL